MIADLRKSVLLFNPHSAIRNRMMRIVGFIIGIVIAAIGGSIAYRALFLEPRTTIVITNTNIHEYPSTLRIACGIILLVIGAAVAFFAVRRKFPEN